MDSDLPDHLLSQMVHKDGSALTPPVGAEYVPPPHVRLATVEQIADFWQAREKYDIEDRANFLAKHDALARNNPNSEMQEREKETNRMRDEVRVDLAKQMTPEDIRDRVEKLDIPEGVKDFAEKLSRAERDGDPRSVEKLCIQEGVKVLKIEDDRARSRYDAENANEASRPADREADKGDDMTPEQRAKLDRLLNSTFRETAREVTGRDDGPPRPPLGEGLRMERDF